MTLQSLKQKNVHVQDYSGGYARMSHGGARVEAEKPFRGLLEKQSCESIGMRMLYFGSRNDETC